MTRSRPRDRYEPLPGLLSLPAFLVRQLGRRGRLALTALAVLAVVGGAVATVEVVPEILDAKGDDAARERRDRAATIDRRRRELEAEQRPRSGRSAAPLSRTADRKRAVLTDLELAIVRDARSRVRDGALDAPPARYASCERRSGAGSGWPRVGLFTCLAVTAEIPRGGSVVGLIGHPFIARVDFTTGRYTWCKVSGRPAEGGYVRPPLVRVPRACGGL